MIVPLVRVCIASSRLRAALGHAEPFLRRHPDAWQLRYLVAAIHLALGAAGRRRWRAARGSSRSAPGRGRRRTTCSAWRCATSWAIRPAARASFERYRAAGAATARTRARSRAWLAEQPVRRAGRAPTQARADAERTVIPAELHERNLRALLAPIAELLDDAGRQRDHDQRPDRDLRRARAAASSATALPLRRRRGAAVRAARDRPVRRPRRRSATQPILEARLPDGSRVEAVLPPAAPDGPVVSIRRFAPAAAHAGARWSRAAACSREGAALLRALVARRRTSWSPAAPARARPRCSTRCRAFIPRRAARDRDRGRARAAAAAPARGAARGAAARRARPRAVSMRALFRATLRLRPDRIVVGEIRGGEAIDLVQAMTSGPRRLPVDDPRHLPARRAGPARDAGADERRGAAARRAARADRLGRARRGADRARRTTACAA